MQPRFRWLLLVVSPLLAVVATGCAPLVDDSGTFWGSLMGYEPPPPPMMIPAPPPPPPMPQPQAGPPQAPAPQPQAEPQPAPGGPPPAAAQPVPPPPPPAVYPGYPYYYYPYYPPAAVWYPWPPVTWSFGFSWHGGGGFHHGHHR